MARRYKRRRAAPRRRASARRAPALRRKSSGGGKDMLMRKAIAFGYGASRGVIQQKAAPILSRVPGGKYAPNLGMALGLWGVGKLSPKMRRHTTRLIDCELYDMGKKTSIGALAPTAAPASTPTFTVHG